MAVSAVRLPSVNVIWECEAPAERVSARARKEARRSHEIPAHSHWECEAPAEPTCFA
jgi:hypothetical protein